MGGAILLALGLALGWGPPPPVGGTQVGGAQDEGTGSDFQALDSGAIEAYRGGDHPTAQSLWLEALELAPGAGERGRILYNLGNAAYRRGERLEAVGWYTAALRYTPRDRDLWANLELARGEAELQPADRGDLAATARRLLTALTPAEGEWLLLGALGVLALALGGEALRGGLRWRRMIALALVAVVFASSPLLWRLAHAGEHPVLVVAEGGIQGRSEPRSDGKALARVDAGSVVELRDHLPGWVKVADDRGRELWLRERAVFDLLR